MKAINKFLITLFRLNKEKAYEGIYGKYVVTQLDQLEVIFYRLSLLLCGLSFFAGISQWIIIGPRLAWIWLILMTIGIGLALKWIHIYLIPLHKTLQLFWIFGCIGIMAMLLQLGPNQLLSISQKEPLWTLAISPLFVALTGIGFKEFFCFQRLEAIGLTFLVPISILSHLFGLLEGNMIIILLSISSILLVILSLRKFGMDPANDIGDKSVFEYLESQKSIQSL